MKKILYTLAITLLTSLTAIGQTQEVIYFKAQLGCCRSRACDDLQDQLKKAVGELFNHQVQFKIIELWKPENADIAKKLEARSQSVFYVANNDLDTAVDLSPWVRQYQRSRDREELMKQLKINIK